MSHPFEVGKLYRNRIGEYEVLAVEGNWMKIRYTTGETLESPIAPLLRIWENIQLEEQLSREEERMRLAREERQKSRRQSKRRRSRSRPKFDGFEEVNFEAKKRGIAWKNRASLGKVLAHEMGRRAKGDFGYWIVPRKSRVQVARQDFFERETRELWPAFFVAADPQGAAYGLRVGKPDGEVKEEWTWSVFIQALADNDEVFRTLWSVMKEHELSLDVYAMTVSYGLVGHIVVHGQDFLYEQKTEDQEITREMNRTELVEYLRTVSPEKRCDLFVRKQLPAADALKAGSGIVSQIASELAAVIPLYEASIGI